MNQTHLRQAIQASDRTALARIGRTKGFSNNHLRKQAWLQLLPKPVAKAQQELSQKLKDDLLKDTNRSFCSSNFKDCRPILQPMQIRLQNMLQQVFKKHGDCYYYQGFHDVATVIKTVYPFEQAVEIASRVGASYCYQYLTDFGPTVLRNLAIIRDIAVLKEPVLQPYLLNQAFIPVSWLLALFYRSFQSMRDVLRVWDYLFSTQPMAVFTLMAGMIVSLAPLITENVNLDDGEVDQGDLVSFFCKVHQRSLPIEDIIKLSQSMLCQERVVGLVRKKLGEESFYYPRHRTAGRLRGRVIAGLSVAVLLGSMAAVYVI